MDDIKTRELFLKIMNFESCPRTLKWEFGYWIGTIDRWYREGLAKVRGYDGILEYGDALHGPGHPHGSTSWSGEIPQLESDISIFFNLDREWSLVPYDYWIFPKFEKKILDENDKYVEYLDIDGVKKRELKDKSSMPMFMEFPVKGRKDWETIKDERFSIDSIDNRFAVDETEFLKVTKDIDKPIGILDEPVGFFGSLRWLIGEERLFMLYYDDPGLIKDILRHLCDLWISISETLTSKLGFDIAVFWEDMAGRQGSLISPSIFREFMNPCYKRIIDFLRSRDIRLFNVDCDGNLDVLIPLFLEAGINSCYPFEQQASNDLIKIRKKYPELRMMGGINKKSLSTGKQEIDRELEKTGFLISEGGYIPYIDHLIPPDISWENFKYYRNKLNNIIYSTVVHSKTGVSTI